MLFNSVSYLIFLPIVFAVYWILPNKYRWIVLLLSSYYFYMSWNVKYVVLILLTTGISYIAAILIEKSNHKKTKQLLLASVLIICLGVLFFFKYFNFTMQAISAVLGKFSIHLHPITLNLLLPVGISFYTFQTLSYVIDVYRGDLKAEHHLGKYATFISFFPQLVAGPIERASNLLPQIVGNHTFSYDSAVYGLRIMLWGLFKKMVVADTLAVYVDRIYNNPSSYHGFVFIIATVFFAFQIYCDFSGYSDIAIGSARLFGIELMQNFRSPYFSASIREFWGRWHISLSTWFRDYLYIPLGGNRVSPLRHRFNLLATFFVSGLWHGANWTYIIWGLIHGGAQVIESFFRKQKEQKNRGFVWVIKVLFVFSFSCFAWIFFRARTIAEAVYVISHSFIGMTKPLDFIITGIRTIGKGRMETIYLCFIILVLLVGDYVTLKQDVFSAISKKPPMIRWLVYLFVVWLIIIFTPVGSGSAFIYFQF